MMFQSCNPVLAPFLRVVKIQFIFLYCYISPEIGYLFPCWTSLKAKTGPLCCCVSVEVEGEGGQPQIAHTQSADSGLTLTS